MKRRQEDRRRATRLIDYRKQRAEVSASLDGCSIVGRKRPLPPRKAKALPLIPVLEVPDYSFGTASTSTTANVRFSLKRAASRSSLTSNQSSSVRSISEFSHMRVPKTSTALMNKSGKATGTAIEEDPSIPVAVVSPQAEVLQTPDADHCPPALENVSSLGKRKPDADSEFSSVRKRSKTLEGPAKEALEAVIEAVLASHGTYGDEHGASAIASHITSEAKPKLSKFVLRRAATARKYRPHGPQDKTSPVAIRRRRRSRVPSKKHNPNAPTPLGLPLRSILMSSKSDSSLNNAYVAVSSHDSPPCLSKRCTSSHSLAKLSDRKVSFSTVTASSLKTGHKQVDQESRKNYTAPSTGVATIALTQRLSVLPPSRSECRDSVPPTRPNASSSRPHKRKQNLRHAPSCKSHFQSSKSQQNTANPKCWRPPSKPRMDERKMIRRLLEVNIAPCISDHAAILGSFKPGSLGSAKKRRRHVRNRSSWSNDNFSALSSSSSPASSRDELVRENSNRSFGSQSSTRKKRKRKRSQSPNRSFGVSRSEEELSQKNARTTCDCHVGESIMMRPTHSDSSIRKAPSYNGMDNSVSSMGNLDASKGSGHFGSSIRRHGGGSRDSKASQALLGLTNSERYLYNAQRNRQKKRQRSTRSTRVGGSSAILNWNAEWRSSSKKTAKRISATLFEALKPEFPNSKMRRRKPLGRTESLESKHSISSATVLGRVFSDAKTEASLRGLLLTRQPSSSSVQKRHANHSDERVDPS